MIVDWHAHVYPPELAKERRWGDTTPLTIENLLEAHEKAGIDLCVVSNTIHYLRDKTHDESLAFLRRWNEYAAEIQQKYKEMTQNSLIKKEIGKAYHLMNLCIHQMMSRQYYLY